MSLSFVLVSYVLTLLLFKLTAFFLLSPVTNFQGNTSQRARREVSKCDKMQREQNFNTLSCL